MTLSEVLLSHELALMFGGRPGILDQNALKSAIGRPYSGYYRTISRKAAALVHSLVLNHGFLDGNKRTALFMMAILIRRSGYDLRSETESQTDAEVEQMLLALANRHMDFEELVQ